MDTDLAIVGGPKSGKTTWLAAFALGVDYRDVAFFDLDIERSPDQRAVAQLKNAIAERRYPQRTNPNEPQQIELLLQFRNPRGETERVRLEAIDYNGEEIEILFGRRTGWTAAWRRRANAPALVLFLRGHQDSTIPFPAPVRRTEVSTPKPEPDADIVGTFGTAGVRTESTPEVFVHDDALKVPTEIALIEVLQFMRHERGLSPGDRVRDDHRQRVSVVLSAWDAVDTTERSLGPRKAFERDYSLLAQFLWSNYVPEDVMVFGLSATGCDLEKLGEGERPPPAFVDWTDDLERVQTGSDVSLPLAWALVGSPALPRGQ